MQLILASNSPRRKDILTRLGYDFTVIPSTFEENNINIKTKKLPEVLATNKAKSVFESLENKTDCVVLGADTIVYFNGEILGKPKTKEKAKIMLKKLSGKTHLVITGYALITENKIISGSVKSKVTFNNLTDEFIEDYITKTNPLDKAGSYGIQDGFNIVKSYKGSFDNIVGLPSEKIVSLLNKFF